jgi:hypothetical protein
MPRLIDDIRAQGRLQKPPWVTPEFEPSWADCQVDTANLSREAKKRFGCRPQMSKE